MAPEGMKKIFISDIHLGDERSFAAPNPYGWIISNISNLANFLEAQINAPDVAEMVILGDLFDTWVIPTDKDPLTSFPAICSYNANLPVIDALKRLAAKGNFLSYVPGNHDMAFSSGGVEVIKQFIENEFPGIRYTYDPDLPTGVYRSGKLVAEHGNRFCLFNAPDTWTNQYSFLPLGYFIARLVAYKVSNYGTGENYHVILRRFVRKFLESPHFIKDIFDAIKDDAQLMTDDLKTPDFLRFPPIVGDIGTFYENLIEKWEKNRQDIGWGSAARYDGFGDLSQAAKDTYFFPSDSDKNIVIFGHTHEADLRRFPRGPDPVSPDTPIDISDRAIYANCGTWVDAVPSTYVETQEDRDAGLQYVRVWTYPDKTLKREDFVEL
jgi:UDP-2,3-diacylglucosamine pyrophosphatase LpxH